MRAKLNPMILATYAALFFISSISSGSEIKLISMTVRDGLESQISTKWPLNNPERIFSSKYFLENQKLAYRAELDLSQYLDSYKVVGYNPSNNNVFVLFYNLAVAPRCNRSYLIQRVRLDKYFYNSKNRLIKEKHEHLVEVMKLNLNKRTKRSDQHIKRYSLQNFFKRRVILECEIGCGKIPGIVEGESWPYSQNILYNKIQNYSEAPGLYDHIIFEASRTYRMEFEFDANGNYSVNWPSFVY